MVPKENSGYEFGDLHGTGFFVSVPPESPKLPRFGYLVTAKHVAEKLQGRPVYLRVNKVGGGYADYENVGENWWLHPTDPTADVAVAVVSPQGGVDIKTIGVELFGTPEVLAELQIGIGDEVFSTGLFTPVESASKNIPIVRHGNISMMPDEQIQTEYGYADVYLVESRSLGGLSGSPIFVRPTINEPISDRPGGVKNMLAIGARVALLGVMHGHWDIREEEMNKPYFTQDRKRGVNYGMAIVVPANKILDILNRPELVEMRMKEETRRLKRSSMVPGTDSVEAETQTTPKGAEIPIPTKEQFLGDLTKASRRVKPD